MNLEIEYYTKENGRSPIKDFINKLPIEAKRETYETFELLSEYGLRIGPTHVKSIKGIKKLWELRIRANKNIYRFLFVVIEGKIIMLLHGFQKKSQKIPKKDIELAIKRMRELS